MKRALLLLALPIAFVAACSTDSGGPRAMGRVNLAVSGQRSMFASGASVIQSGDSTVIAADSDTVIVKSVDLVLRRIELKPVETAACDTVGDEGEHSDSAEHADSAEEDGVADQDAEGCEEIKSGPALVSLPLGGTAIEALVGVAAPAGQYDALEFKIHAPRLPRDSAFLAANPGFDSISIKVTGTFSHKGTRTDFTFTSGLEAEEESEINPPLVVDASGTANVTLRFDISGWFAGAGGVGVVDPGSAANAGLINENIRRSIDAFEDDNHDGHDDHSGEGGGEGDG